MSNLDVRNYFMKQKRNASCNLWRITSALSNCSAVRLSSSFAQKVRKSAVPGTHYNELECARHLGTFTGKPV